MKVKRQIESFQLLYHTELQEEMEAANAAAARTGGDARCVELLLAAGAEPAPGDERPAPLAGAVLCGDAASARLLLRAGAAAPTEVEAPPGRHTAAAGFIPITSAGADGAKQLVLVRLAVPQRRAPLCLGGLDLGLLGLLLDDSDGEALSVHVHLHLQLPRVPLGGALERHVLQEVSDTIVGSCLVTRT